MIITPVECDLSVAASDLVRSPGLHLSAIYNDLFQDLEPKRFTRGTLPDPLRLEAGLSMELMLEEGIKRRLSADRPGEFFTEEGIAFSPDLLINNGVLRLGEIKLTWLSSRDVPRESGINVLPPKFDKYLVQMKGYCHALGTPYARLYVFFVNGDYTHPYSPELLSWDIEFTERELQENWEMLINHAKQKRML